MRTKRVPTEFFCPLGAECEDIVDGVIKRCAWYVKIEGMDANTGKTADNTACSLAWLPILMIETSVTNRAQTEATESFRNETVKGQAEFNTLIKESMHRRDPLSIDNTQVLGEKNEDSYS